MTDEPATRGTTVLIVDDDANVRLVTGMLLEQAGCIVREASDGNEAISALRDGVGEIDVILLDVMMPEMSGPEALPRLREIVPNIPVIFYSGYGESEVAEYLADGGAHTSFLPKPTDIQTLASRIEQARGDAVRR